MIAEKKVITGRELIEAKRKDVMGLREKATSWWDSPASQRYKDSFGPNLTEKDGSISVFGRPFDEHRCDICDRIPGLDEKLMLLEFDIGGEYMQDVIICPDCLQEMLKDLGK